MPMGSVTLKSGVDTQATLSLNEAHISESQLIRFKNGYIQTVGGWISYGSLVSGSTVRDLHPWQDSIGVSNLGIAATSNLTVYSSATGALDITPQTRISSLAPNLSISTAPGSLYTVTVTDPNAGPSLYNTAFFNTPISIGNLLINGPYKITGVLSTGAFSITSSVAASTTIVSSGILPLFVASSGSPNILVTLANHNFISSPGLYYSFRAPTTVGSFTVDGPYTITSIVDSTSFYITETVISTGTQTSSMNNGLAQINYYVTIGAQAAGSGFGAGTYGSGGFGTGTTIVGSVGTAITATDWTQDNWGEILISCPSNGAIYIWSREGGFSNAQVIDKAPFFNGGVFISMPQQILVAWKTTQAISGTQDNLEVAWSDAGDYEEWEATNATTAGSFHIPTGSVLKGGLQAPSYGVVWTDVDVWIMSYVGGDVIFNFTRAGTGCGLLGSHAAGVISNQVYWAGQSNIFVLGEKGVTAVPCSVWDFMYQNLNPTYVEHVRCCPNSAFNEIMWEFPSLTASENDSYIKFNIIENVWDYGSLQRTAWTDISALGNPIAADSQGLLWQHDTGQAVPGAGSPTFRSGWWAIAEGESIGTIDFVIPDFIWGTYASAKTASVSITFYSSDYPNGPVTTHGPYTVTSATQYITPRIRGRLMSVLVQSQNAEFWRLGKIRFRFAISGRR